MHAGWLPTTKNYPTQNDNRADNEKLQGELLVQRPCFVPALLVGLRHLTVCLYSILIYERCKYFFLTKLKLKAKFKKTPGSPLHW